MEQMLYIPMRYVVDSNMYTIRRARAESTRSSIDVCLEIVDIRFVFALVR